jgi:DNA repair protein RecO (recombination protein O)
MPATEQCSGFVLRKRTLPGNDQVVILFTREKGKVAAVARGIRSITSKRAAHLQTGNLVELHLRTTIGMPQAQQTVLVSAFRDIKEDLRKMDYLYAYLFVIDKLLPELVPEEEVYAETVAFVSRLARAQYPSTADFRQSLERVSGALGYTPESGDRRDVTERIEELIDAKIPLRDII